MRLIGVYSPVHRIGIYESQKRNYRRGVEHGSAKWGNVSEICRRYCEKQYTQNLLLTQHFRMGLDGYKHKTKFKCAGSRRFRGRKEPDVCNPKHHAVQLFDGDY